MLLEQRGLLVRACHRPWAARPLPSPDLWRWQVSWVRQAGGRGEGQGAEHRTLSPCLTKRTQAREPRSPRPSPSLNGPATVQPLQSTRCPSAPPLHTVVHVTFPALAAWALVPAGMVLPHCGTATCLCIMSGCHWYVSFHTL